MRKSLRALLCASAFLGFVAVASAGDFAQPHFTHLYPSQFTSTPGTRDSMQFALEGSGSGKLSLLAVYDTTAVTDTLTTIPMDDNAGMTSLGYGPAASHSTTSITPDSVWVGRLTLHFSSSLASTDSVWIFKDVSSAAGPYGWASQASVALGSFLRLGAGRDAAQTVVADIWTAPAKTKLAVPAAATANAIWGASALRFRLVLGVSSTPKTIDKVEWLYLSTNPDANR